jgi:hypothetical protein
VAERLLGIFHERPDEDAESFDRRVFRGLDNLVHRIAKQRKGTGPIDREVVRRAVLELAWDAHAYVGDCVCVLMQAFRQALPTPLDDREGAWYETLFYGQDYLGGLPLVLLRHRFEFLEGAFADLVARPGDPAAVGVLLRLLAYYGEMASARREVDRAWKRRDPSSGRRRADPVRTRVRDATRPRTGPLVDRFRPIVAHLLEGRGLGCACPDFDARLCEGAGRAAHLCIAVECERCGYAEEVRVGRAEFEQVGRVLFPEDTRGPTGGLSRADW